MAVLLATHPVYGDRWVDGIFLVFGVIVFSSLFLIPSVKSLKSYLFAILHLFIGTLILESIVAPFWEVDTIKDAVVPYNNFYGSDTDPKLFIVADVGIRIGLGGFNVTLLGKPEYPDNLGGHERVNYNEHFSWAFRQNQQLSEDHEHAFLLGKPWPILQVADAMIQDGDHLRWGRQFRLGGYYCFVLLWCAFGSWAASALLAFLNKFYSGFALISAGVFSVLAILTYSVNRYGNMFHIYVESGTLLPSLWRGWCLWFVVVATILSFTMGTCLMYWQELSPKVYKVQTKVAKAATVVSQRTKTAILGKSGSSFGKRSMPAKSFAQEFDVSPVKAHAPAEPNLSGSGIEKALHFDQALEDGSKRKTVVVSIPLPAAGPDQAAVTAREQVLSSPGGGIGRATPKLEPASPQPSS
mmetsp:Transcript_14541/g.24056  ORF Transcript_14541/g.24056 Transcript_14541/m.24056 type:complete len:411 (+) Transcript_14541:147-1379(+)|eukprot:CAMPEP_0184663952 /NCGR_PEP_ID=MMETSP0308-20130426/50606_1 /TAXON_ID=38269 /ORGANISM="Gloeochaete witrockiana, Strain SAG 46.84" /LENGTH=410 /DNA_ID=CAMNT_0027107045 /DNA_START=82 /DNA_END=1314 /DNA_ORIENTATION=+